MANTKDRVTGAVTDVRPYVQRALTDEEVRESVKAALAAGRAVYDQLMSGRSFTTLASRVASDKQVQENLKSAIDELRNAADRVQGKDSHKTRNTIFLITGVALGLLFNPMTGPATRRWISETMFGGGEDDYTFPQNDSVGSPPPPPAV
jgi:hypothetical protein